MKIKRFVVVIISVVLLLLLSSIIVIFLLLHASTPETDGFIELPGINSDISILYDAKGIPQIWAENEQDAWFALGWLHAGDRLFQMDLTRRIAYGKLSEIFGELTLSIDHYQRTIGHNIIAKKSIPELQEPIIQYLNSYSMGVNQWVQHTDALPFEFYLLGTEFEPWSAKDCLTILSFQTWFSNDLQNADNFFLNLEDQTGRHIAEEIIAPYPPSSPTTTASEAFPNNNQSLFSVFNCQQNICQSLFSGGKLPFLLSDASNAWVISADKSRSGQAMLASDPHLELSRLPQFWYVAGVHSKQNHLDVLGITTPGIPLIIMGHNDSIAWAFTAGGVDITDEYAERLNPDNTDQYLKHEKYVPFERRYEFISVRGRDHPDTVLIKSTRHGPVIEENVEKGEVYALKWAGFDQSPSKAISAGFTLMHSSNFDQFRNAVTQLGALDAHWVYADNAGNIGYQLGTPIPIRRMDERYTRVPGWDERYDWLGYHPLEETPYALNPEKGWLATCNNKPENTTLSYPIFGNFADDRIQRINALLSDAGTFSVTQMKDFQQDLKSITLLHWKDELKKNVQRLNQSKWLEEIERWDGNADIDSRVTALLEIWLSLMKQYTFEDDFPDQIKNFLNGIHYRDRNFERIYFDTQSIWFDDIRTTNKKETRDELALKAMQEAIQKTGSRNWGKIQTLTMAHPMSEVPLVSTVLSLKKGPFPKSGTTGTLNNSTAFVGEDGEFIARGGPSWRFVLDFADINNCQMVIPAGQSGNPVSDHFFDFYDLWFKGDYWTVPFEREKVEESAVSTLILKRLIKGQN